MPKNADSSPKRPTHIPLNRKLWDTIGEYDRLVCRDAQWHSEVTSGGQKIAYTPIWGMTKENLGKLKHALKGLGFRVVEQNSKKGGPRLRIAGEEVGRLMSRIDNHKQPVGIHALHQLIDYLPSLTP